jgi:type II secretory ATPase GspE/PulE/Tfp pilus assembly ATPase PilB-like protein
VLAELMTYKSDIPQEGRITGSSPDVEMRLSTFPTVHGEKAVIRLFIGSGKYRTLNELGLPADLQPLLLEVLEATSGVLIVAGPAGSGKTTTLYACLRHIQASHLHARSISTLEDPVEALLPGAAQSQIKPSAGFSYASGLKSLLRQDPDVIMVGEIRDAETSQIVFQASLTGHLVLSSFHAGTSAEAISRLGDMGIEPYVLRSGLRAILAQKLIRLLCKCSREVTDTEDFLGLPVTQARQHVGCPECLQTGYQGRLLLAELLLPRRMELRQAILSRSDAAEINRLMKDVGVKTVFDRAVDAVNAGRTSPEEIRRLLGAD